MSRKITHKKPDSRLATASCILGLLGLVFGFITGLPAIFFGHTARDLIRRRVGLGGRRKALLGMVLGYITTIASFVVLIAFAEMKKKGTKSPRDTKRNIARAQIAELVLEVENYRDIGGSYPTGEQGLHALVEKPAEPPVPVRWRQQYFTVPLDPWGQPYHYVRKKPDELGLFEIFSSGPDGLKRTDDDISRTRFP
ncbi:MAG: DUF4190 domain-containing protein [Akkermansiaceae bacterium]|nr:DUF4190 domain-containing protein [Akkermansiaceae bacterium]